MSAPAESKHTLCDDGEEPYAGCEVSIFRGRGDEWLALEWWDCGIGWVVCNAGQTIYSDDGGPQQTGPVNNHEELVEALRLAAGMAGTYAGILQVNDYPQAAVDRTLQRCREFTALLAKVSGVSK